MSLLTRLAARLLGRNTGIDRYRAVLREQVPVFCAPPVLAPDRLAEAPPTGLSFAAIDVETANGNPGSICAIGLALFQDGRLRSVWNTLIDPESEFTPFNTRLHGIDALAVRGSPRLSDVVPVLVESLSSLPVVSHTMFDRRALRSAFARYGLPEIEAVWIDSAEIARRTWTECAEGSRKLPDVCRVIGYRFNHHDPLEDAKAAAQIVLAASAATGFDLVELHRRSLEPVSRPPAAPPPHTPIDIPHRRSFPGPLSGETIVFTGDLGMSRYEAEVLALAAGCSIKASVSRKVTMLVVGAQNLALLAGHTKSSKQRRAEELIAQGHRIRILSEDAFYRALAGDRAG